MKRVAVVGLGTFGATVAEELARLGYRVAALDVDPVRVQRIETLVRDAVVGDATEPEVLSRIGAGDADAAVVSTGRDVTASVLIALALRDLGVPEIHVKVISTLHARILDKLGISDTIFPEHESAGLLAKRVTNRRIVRYLELGEGFSAQEMTVPSAWVGRSLRELELPRSYGISVVAVHDFLEGKMIPIPDPDAPLKDSDALLVAGADAALAKAAALR